MKDGKIYEGEFQHNKFHGKGKLTWPNQKAIYTGDFINGRREGRGKIVYLSGKIYEGEWHNGLEHGLGTVIDRGDISKGEWTDGKLTTSLSKSKQK